MAKTKTIPNTNITPALTWTWLKMNGASVNLKEMPISTDAKTVENKNSKDSVNVESTGLNTKIEAKSAVQTPILLHYEFEDGKRYSGEQTVTAEENAEVTVIMDYTSEKNAGGISEIKTKLIAKPYSKIHLVKVQLLGSGFTQIDDTQCEADENAFIDVTQIELGGKDVYAQVKTELNGYKSKFKSDTAYIAKEKQLLDMNYAVNHHGADTDTKMHAKGVVDGNATKVYRGTIDFKNGCHGATGDEQEETLLLSPAATNKSLPVILCDEEDVSGTHGATLGRLGADELFYMQSRGISEDEAKKMMSRAKIISVANLIPNDEIIEKIADFIDN